MCLVNSLFLETLLACQATFAGTERVQDALFLIYRMTGAASCASKNSLLLAWSTRSTRNGGACSRASALFRLELCDEVDIVIQSDSSSASCHTSAICTVIATGK